MNISVVIPTVGRESIKTTLKALERQTRKVHETIVVRDEDRNGASWARNRGYERATGEVIAFTDDDCEPPEEWIQSIQDIIAGYQADVVGGTYQERDPLLADIRRIRKSPPQDITQDEQENVGIAGNVAFKRELLEKVRATYGHVYDESIILGEDYELMWRTKTIGARIFFNPTRVIHHRLLTKAKYVRLQLYRGVGIASLDQVRKRYQGITTHRSILWEDTGPLRKAVRLLTHKIIGPFNAKQFSTTGNFVAYWLGAKVEALGYLYGRLYKDAGWKTYAKDEVRPKGTTEGPLTREER